MDKGVTPREHSGSLIQQHLCSQEWGPQNICPAGLQNCLWTSVFRLFPFFPFLMGLAIVVILSLFHHCILGMWRIKLIFSSWAYRLREEDLVYILYAPWHSTQGSWALCLLLWLPGTFGLLPFGEKVSVCSLVRRVSQIFSDQREDWSLYISSSLSGYIVGLHFSDSFWN